MRLDVQVENGTLMMRSVLCVVIVLFTLALPVAAQDADPASGRPFELGFTPFPYDISFEAVTWVYQTLPTDADLMVHHFDNGIPWPEALAGTPYSEHIRSDWNLRRTATPADMPIMVTITPINFARDGLAAYRGDADDMPLPAPWDSYNFDHPDVEKAFVNYARDIIAYFQPDYLLMGIEVNLLMKIRPDRWDAYMTLQRAAYATLKAEYPDLPIFVSLTGIDLLPGYTDVDSTLQAQALADVLPYTDWLGLSIYPYMTRFMTGLLPEDFFDDLAALTDKPIAITETGYPAQDLAIRVGDVRIEMPSDDAKQADYIQRLLAAAQAHQFRLVINFVLRDYDALWRAIGAREDLTIAWRDTGLYAEDGRERPALAAWRAALAQPWIPPDNEGAQQKDG